jgi:TRAP transporter TAXI family solute receptor
MVANITRRALMGAAAGVALLAADIGDATAQQRFITIGTGGVTGVYYPAGGAICRLVNANRREHGIRCSVESTGGSVYNVNTMRAGDLDIGVVQSDIQFKAMKGEGPEFEPAGPYEGLRALFGLHGEPFTVVARADAGIKTFEDLRGKRVNVGNPGSGQRSTMDVVLEAKGWSISDFSLASELRPAEQSQALCDNRVDAIIYTVGHPNGSIQEATTSCPSVLVAVEGPEIDGLLEQFSYYAAATIPGGMYTGNPEDVRTFGVTATVVASTDVPEEVAYEVVKAVFENFDDFKSLHPAFGTLTREDMTRNGLSAPLHPGAEKYFKEAGLL